MGDCEQIRRQLADYCVGGMSRRRRARVAAHLRACASCGAELEALERTGAVLEAVGVEAAPDDWERVRQQLCARPRQRRRPAFRVAWGVGMAAVGVVLLILGGLVLRPGDQTTLQPPAVSVDTELRGTMEDHLSAVWAAPLADEAAVGLRLAELDEDG